jgi:hypothetical protein
VSAFGPGQDHDVRFKRRAVGQENGWLHPVQRPLNASRSLEKNPC